MHIMQYENIENNTDVLKTINNAVKKGNKITKALVIYKVEANLKTRIKFLTKRFWSLILDFLVCMELGRLR